MKSVDSRILVIDDEPQITRVIRTALTANGFDARTANDPEEGLRLYSEWMPDLVITDLVMPGLTGVEVCKAIRSSSSSSSIPVLVLSVRDRDLDKVEALNAGADDFIVKPFSAPELVARIRAHLRRAPQRASLVIARGDFSIDASEHTASVKGQMLRLSPKEFDLLLQLMRNAGRMTTHQDLLVSVWGEGSANQTEYLRVLIGQLRKKLEGASRKRYIQTEPRIGYRLVPEGIKR